MVRRFTRTLGLWLTLMASVPALAAEPGTDTGPAFIAEVEASFEKLELEKVELLCAERLSEPGNSTEVLKTLYLYQGMVYALGDRADQAVESFKRLIAVRPSAKLPPDAGPHIMALYEKAQEFWKDKERFGLAHTPPAVWPTGTLVTLEFAVTGDILTLADSVVVHVRALGATTWSKVTTLGTGGTLSVDLAALGTTGPPDAIEYYINVLDPFGGLVLSAGSPEDPYVLRNKGGGSSKGPKGSTDPAPKKKGLWIGVGVGVGAGVAVAAVTIVILSVLGRNTTGPIDVVFRVAGE